MSRGIRFRAIKRKAIFGFCRGGDIKDGILIILYSDSINRIVAKQITIKRNAKNFLLHLWWNFPEFDLRFIRSSWAPNLGLSISNTDKSQPSQFFLFFCSIHYSNQSLHVSHCIPAARGIFSTLTHAHTHTHTHPHKFDSNLNISDAKKQVDR